MRIVVLILAFAGYCFAGEPPSSTTDEIAALRRQITAQQQQIDELRKAVDALISRREPASNEPAQAAAGQAAAASPATAVRALAAGNEPGTEGPLSFPIGAADFTPGGFMDATAVVRSTNSGGIGTSFGAIPFANTTQGKLSEARFSAQNSRVSLKIAAPHGGTSVTGYLEADFLGAQPANAYVSSNSLSLRMRQYWVDVRRGRWETLAGQAWTLMTPNRAGVLPNPAEVFNTANMDTNYQAGLVWARQPGIRIVYHASKSWTAAAALENAQQYTGNGVTLPSPSYALQVDTGGNLATPNPHPDVIGKIAWDRQGGKRAMHVEVAGLARGFRVVRPDLTRSSARGFGGSVNAVLELRKNLRLITTTFVSQGGGRYVYGLGPDLVVRPNGDLSPVRAAAAIGGFEYQATPAAMLFTYYGGTYFERNFGISASGEYSGFGYPGSPTAANRSIQEATFGYVHTFWKNPQFGALQVINQYSYLTRSPWSVPAGSPGHATSHMFWTNLRFVLP